MATLVRWEPFRELATFQNELSRLMNGLYEGNGRTKEAWVPTLDACETEEEIVYAFDLPGVPEEQIEVELEGTTLTLTARRERTEETRKDAYYRYERRFGTFTRTVGVPEGTTDADVTATYEHGVLELHVRKPEQQKPRRIEIGVRKPATIEGTATEA